MFRIGSSLPAGQWSAVANVQRAFAQLAETGARLATADPTAISAEEEPSGDSAADFVTAATDLVQARILARTSIAALRAALGAESLLGTLLDELA